MKTTNTKQPQNDMDKLIGKLQSEDRRNGLVMRNFKWFMWVMSPVYFVLLVVAPFSKVTLYERIGGVCFSLAFLIFAVLFRKYYKVYRLVDYGLPTVKMLTQAIKRYNLPVSRIGAVMIPILLIDIGMVFISFLHTDQEVFYSDIFYFQLLYFGLMTIAALVGITIWRIREKPLRDSAKSLLNEIEGE